MKRKLGFFTRLLDDGDAATRYRLATEQILHAEAHGFDTAWVAQHHFHESEGGLPAPFVFLAHVAAKTCRIRLGTGIVTLPLENPIRAAEDAAVLDLLSDGRLEFGVGPGGTAESFETFGLPGSARNAIMERHLALVRNALGGGCLSQAAGSRLYPAAPALLSRLWQATFSAGGGARAGAAGDGLMLSRTQPRPDDAPDAALWDIQDPIVDAYLAALPAGCVPRIMGSRSVFVADSRAEAHALAEAGIRRSGLVKEPDGAQTLEMLIRRMDLHVGTPDDVIRSLRADRTLARVTDIACQVHPMDPPHAQTLRSIELIAREVAPALGLR